MIDSRETMAQLASGLDAFRHLCDPLADGAIAAIIRGGRPGKDLVGALEAQARAGSKACADLLDHANTVPAWVDFEQMKCGAQLGLRTPLQSALSLVLGSLIESYGSAKGAKVLIRGGMLERQVLQRLQDTTGFLLRIASSRGPRPGSPAHRHILRTRLVHGFVRHGVLKRPDWNEAEWGHPINQEDYASTLLQFSHVYLRGMAQLGAAATEEEERSVHHMYQWVGTVMGVDPRLLTATRDDERRLYSVITWRQLHPDEDGKRLTAALINTLGGRPPFFLPADALGALSRHLVGDTLADGLGLPRPRAWGQMPIAFDVLGALTRTAERLPLGKFAMEHLGERVARVIHDRALRPPAPSAPPPG